MNNFKSALEKLKDGISDYEKTQLDVVRDGVIQRFEFTTELAWKTVREYLLNEGLVDLNTPKAVVKEAFSAGIIDDENGWLRILNDRNSTSHIYEQRASVEVFERIKTDHVALFAGLLKKLVKNS